MPINPQVRQKASNHAQLNDQEIRSMQQPSLQIVPKTANEKDDQNTERQDTVIAAVAIIALIALTALLVWYTNYYDLQGRNSDTLARTSAETGNAPQATDTQAPATTGATQ